MKGIRTHSWILIAAFAVGTSCHRRKAPKVTSTAPPIVLPKREPPPPQRLPAPPPIDPSAPPTNNPPVLVEVSPPPVVAPKPVPQKKAGGRGAKKSDGKAVEAAQVKPDATEPPTAPPAQTPAGPKLGQMLNPEQVKEFNKRLDAALEHTRGAVLILQGKRLNSEQKETVGRVRSFLQQAEQTREQDVAAAVSLAERAALLSRDLLDRLR